MGYKVSIDRFEGPLDLLVYLIESSKMSIYDIEIREITSQYINYMKEIEEDIEYASDFMVLASTLLNIKSKMILPKTEDVYEEDEKDPRKMLVNMILEYKKIKNIADFFEKRNRQASMQIAKPMEDIEHILKEPIELLRLDESEFIKSFEKFLIKKKKVIEIKRNYDNIQRKRITSQERLEWIRELVNRDFEIEIDFFNTVKDKKDKYDVAVSFSAILEMIRQREIDGRQEHNFGEIKIRKVINTEERKNG